MKNSTLWAGVISLILISQSSFAQIYCTPPPFFTGPYTGITNVTLSTLDNDSPDNEGVKYFQLVAAPILTIGTEYVLSVTTSHNLIGTFSGNLNTYVWIDWNQDGDFLDPEEIVYRVDDKYKGTYTRKFTVPTSAKNGVTRMRVYNDMPVYEGHAKPHPCGYAEYPTNPLGHHGEVEDYNVEVNSASTGITELSKKPETRVFFNSSSQVVLNINLAKSSVLQVNMFNTLGQEVLTSRELNLTQGLHSINLGEVPSYQQGLFILNIIIDGKSYSEKFLVN